MIKIQRSNLQSFCRTCLGQLHSADGSSNFIISETPNLAKLLIICTTLNVNDDEDFIYPQSLCKKCYDMLQQFRDFRDMALQSSEVLRKILSDTSEYDKNTTTSNTQLKDDVNYKILPAAHNFKTEPEYEIEFEIAHLQENYLPESTNDIADSFLDSDTSTPTTSTARKRKLTDYTDEKLQCKIFGCSFNSKSIKTLVEHTKVEHAIESESEKEDLCENSIFTELLRDSKILFEKDCTPIAKNKKKSALEALTVAYNLKTKQNMNTVQILKKFNNMKTRIKTATDKNRTGSKKIVLKKWEKLFYELWTGEENNPFLSRVPVAKANMALRFSKKTHENKTTSSKQQRVSKQKREKNRSVKQKNQTQEQKQRRAENARVAVTKFKAKLKENPEKLEAYLRKNREYYHSHKNTVSNQLSQEDIRNKRLYERNRKRSYRRKKNLNEYGNVCIEHT